MSVLVGYGWGQVVGWRRVEYALCFEPVGSYHCGERKYFAIYGYNVLGDVKTACITQDGCTGKTPR